MNPIDERDDTGEGSGGRVEGHLTDAGRLAVLARALALPGHDPDDLAQEAFLGLERSGQDQRWAERPAAYLRGVLRHVAARSARTDARRRRRERDRSADRPRTATSPDQELERMELYARLAQHVASLPPAQAKAVTQRYFDGLPVAEIAARRGVAPASVRSTLAKALGSLRERLDRSEGGREAWLALVGAPILEARHRAHGGVGAGALGAVGAVVAGLVVALVVDGVGSGGTGAPGRAAGINESQAVVELPEASVPEAPRQGPSAALAPKPATAVAAPALAAAARPEAPAAELADGLIRGQIVDANLGTGVGELRIHLIAHGAEGEGEPIQASAVTDPAGIFAVPSKLAGAERYTAIINDRFGGDFSGGALREVELPFHEPIPFTMGPTYFIAPESCKRIGRRRGVEWFLRGGNDRRERRLGAAMGTNGHDRVRFTVPFVEGDRGEGTPTHGGPWTLEVRARDGLVKGTATVTRNLGVEPAPIHFAFEACAAVEFIGSLPEGFSAGESRFLEVIHGPDERLDVFRGSLEGRRLTFKATHLVPGPCRWRVLIPGLNGSGIANGVAGQSATFDMTPALATGSGACITAQLPRGEVLDPTEWRFHGHSTSGSAVVIEGRVLRMPANPGGTATIGFGDHPHVPFVATIIPPDGLRARPSAVEILPGEAPPRVSIERNREECEVKVAVVDAASGFVLPTGVVQVTGRGVSSAWVSQPLRLPKGTDPYVLTVTRPGYKAEAVRLDGGDEAVTIRLHPAENPPIPVRVVYATDFGPAEGVSVHVDGVLAGRTDPCGLVWIRRERSRRHVVVGRGDPQVRVLTQGLGGRVPDSTNGGGGPVLVERRP